MNDIIYAGKHSLTYTVSRHVHASLELVYCTEGHGCFYFGEDALPYEAGDIVIIPPDMPHSNLSETGFTNIHINLSDTLLNIQRPERIRDDSNRFLLNAFTAALFHFTMRNSRRNALLSAYGNLLVSYLVAYRESPPRSRVVEEIAGTIIRSYQNPDFELDTYLRSLPFSYDYLRRLFKKETGVTPHQYLTDKRLQSAADMLSVHYEGGNITEISSACGFREPLYFSRMFKKKFGVSPSAYLHTHRSDASERYLDSENVKIMLEDLNA